MSERGEQCRNEALNLAVPYMRKHRQQLYDMHTGLTVRLHTLSHLEMLNYCAITFAIACLDQMDGVEPFESPEKAAQE